MHFKKVVIYPVIIIVCITAYFISKQIVAGKIIEKRIEYVSDKPSEVYMVWGFMNGDVPPQRLWPTNSYLEHSMIYTKMDESNGKFATLIRLPQETEIYYWIVLKKDKNGNAIDVWETGGVDKKYFLLVFTSWFKPGIFIFLAGFIPLVLALVKSRKHSLNSYNPGLFGIKDYVPQFDSIRAIAVLLVIVHHWFEENTLLNFTPNGQLGVNIFFVLSGFLITGILLKAKKQVEEEGYKKSTVFKNFYIRRTLRIFPIYYLLLIIFWILNDPAIKEDGVYYFTYTTNYLFYSEQLFPARLSHLWSLAVEEQFYIFWPWLIILVNKKYLPYLISFFIIIGISSNYIFISKSWWIEILTPTCFDAFATGGLLSYLIAHQPETIEKIQPKFKWIFAIILVLFLFDVFNYPLLPRRTSHTLIAIAIIYYCLFKNNIGFMNYILNIKWLIRIGKISYGVYLYHLFIPELWAWVIGRFASWNIDLLYNSAMPAQFKPAWLFIQHFLFLIIICLVSWKLIEKPVQQLKSRFQNKPPCPQPIRHNTAG